MKIYSKTITEYKEHLIKDEKSPLTIEKYIRDINAFMKFTKNRKIEREVILQYKQHIIENYKPTSVNSMLASINGFFKYVKLSHLKIKPLKIQKSMFASSDKELENSEYRRLVKASKLQKNERLCLVMQTICSTGIRVSELKFITAEAVSIGRAEVSSKGKIRTVFITQELKKLLLRYIKKNRIISGCVFLSKHGNPLNRHIVWSEMKKLCEDAGVAPSKVFPHNLRHLFARTFYSIEKDLGRLADILGHSNINTTRIYTMECGREHKKILEKMSLICCRI